MDFASILEAFTQVGVPIACLVVTFNLWNKEREDHKQEMKEVAKTIEQNTLAIQKLTDKLDKE